MFERFTERARKVMVLAQEEARRLRHNYIGTEHLLLGLLREDTGIAAQVLGTQNITLSAVREQVESIVGYGEEEPGGQAPFTPRSKKVLEMALRESMQLGHNYIGTEHTLLGLMKESEGVAARVLSNLDVASGNVRREVLRMLGGEPESEVVEDQPLFRGRIRALQISVRVGGQPGTLLMDLDYSYSAGETGEQPEAMNHGEVLERVSEVLEGREYPSVEAVVLEAGRLILDLFPPVHEVEISAVRERVSERRTASGITVSRTFRR